jgi:hypothetical protein
MRRAAAISAAAHCRAMRAAAPGRFEYEIEAELMHEFRRCGAQAPAYAPIVAGGANACILHYVGNVSPLRDGDCCSSTPAARSTPTPRTSRAPFPVSGKFSPAQRDVYELVLAAQRAAIAADRAGQALGCAARGGGARAGAGHARPEAAFRQPGRRHRVRRLPPLLHAPHRPLARHGRARRRRIQDRRRLAPLTPA